MGVSAEDVGADYPLGDTGGSARMTWSASEVRSKIAGRTNAVLEQARSQAELTPEELRALANCLRNLADEAVGQAALQGARADQVSAALPVVTSAATTSATTSTAVATSSGGGTAADVYESLPALFSQGIIGLEATSDVRLLNAGHVVHLWKNGGRFGKRQDQPETAFLTKRPRHIVAISYGWLAQAQPDGEGWHLSIIGPVLDLFVRNLIEAGEADDAGDVGFFLDFSCLWQKPRTKEQDVGFGRALSRMHYIYGHRLVFLWAQTKMPPNIERNYWTRGWCFFELLVAGLIKQNRSLGSWSAEMRKSAGMNKVFLNVRLLDLAKLEPTAEEIRLGLRGANAAVRPEQISEFYDVVKACSEKIRRPPLSPAKFAAELSNRVFTNGKSDHDAVIEQYERTLEEVLGSVTILDFAQVGWGDADVEALADILPRCTRLRSINLQYNSKATSKGVGALVLKLPPSVTEVDLTQLRIDFVVPGKERDGKGRPNRYCKTREEVQKLREFFL